MARRKGKIVNRRELAEILGMDVRTVDALVRRGMALQKGGG
jgi:phage terminase Nu1 subunit (DNA packaging protein)